MPKVIKNKFTSVVLNSTDIIKEIDKIEDFRIRKAARYGAKIMRKNASSEGSPRSGAFPRKREGKLARSIGFRYSKLEKKAKIGSKSSKVHLTEFEQSNGKSRTKFPLIAPSLREAEDKMVTILSESYWG